MGLVATARLDAGRILEDADRGFGYTITLTTPDGDTADVTGFSIDIAQAIDPDTGMLVSGRTSHITVRTALVAEKFPSAGQPVGISDSSGKPWLAEIDGNTFKMYQTDPDATLGVITCRLEAYEL